MNWNQSTFVLGCRWVVVVVPVSVVRGLSVGLGLGLPLKMERGEGERENYVSYTQKLRTTPGEKRYLRPQ